MHQYTNWVMRCSEWGFVHCPKTSSIWREKKEFGGEGKRCRRHRHQLFEEQSDDFWCMFFTQSQTLQTNHPLAIFAQLFGSTK